MLQFNDGVNTELGILPVTGACLQSRDPGICWIDHLLELDSIHFKREEAFANVRTVTLTMLLRMRRALARFSGGAPVLHQASFAQAEYR
jgi:hypothetical protein